MEQYISKSTLVAEIRRIMAEEMSFLKDCYKDELENTSSPVVYTRMEMLLSFINTLEVKEIPETTHIEHKKIKKLCEIQRYDEDGKAYSVMLPDSRLFMNKINDVIDAIDNIDSRLQMVEQKI